MPFFLVFLAASRSFFPEKEEAIAFCWALSSRFVGFPFHPQEKLNWEFFNRLIGSRNHILNRRDRYGKRKSRLLPGLCEYQQSCQGEKISFGLSRLAPVCG